jgi:hypothetical protein
MTDTPTDTHFACDARLRANGSRAECCDCVPHDCDEVERLINEARINEVGRMNMGDVEYPRKRLDELRTARTNKMDVI